MEFSPRVRGIGPDLPVSRSKILIRENHLPKRVKYGSHTTTKPSISPPSLPIQARILSWHGLSGEISYGEIRQMAVCSILTRTMITGTDIFSMYRLREHLLMVLSRMM